MSRFYGSMSGKAKTEATREGTARSGLGAHIRGWHAGIRIEAYAGDDDRDTFRIFCTAGSNGYYSSDILIGYVVDRLGGREFIPNLVRQA